MTKTEVLSSIMYNLKFNDSVDFENSNGGSYSINRVLDENKWFRGWEVVGNDIERMFFTTKTDLKKGISKLGRELIEM
jgi:hypothetical protein